MRLKTGMIVVCVMLLAVGCRPASNFLKPEQQKTIDRAVVDYPPNFDLKVIAENLNCPTALCFDQDGTMFLVEGGIAKEAIHIFGRRADGSPIEIYPRGTRMPFVGRKFEIFGPIGGIAASNGKLYVSHRDANGMGVITAFGYDGSHSTVVSEFPAQGDYGITDVAISPKDGRLYFGVGPATNSGVVGADNASWLKDHPDAHDISAVDLKLYGLKFRTRGSKGGFFGGSDGAVTGAFQPYNIDNRTRIKKPVDGKSNSAVFSVAPVGGDLILEAFGIRLPRGLGFEETYATLLATNDGMELRGTRPVKDDPDALVKISSDAWYGFPDYTSSMLQVSEEQFQPPSPMVMNSGGYPDNSLLIDRGNSNIPSGLYPPKRDVNLKGVFPWQSGAAKFDFIPSGTTVAAFRKFRGQVIVALSGDRAPFSTSGAPITGPLGYKLVSVNLDNKKVEDNAEDFVFNTKLQPASKQGRGVVALERPCDVKMGPDGSLYILDMGEVSYKDGVPNVSRRTGRIFKLEPIIEPERPSPK